MTGADILIKTALACGIEICFANAGTTEIPLVVALDRQPGIAAVLGLFEGVCTAAADGYGRMKNSPALALLHLGPGFANGIANLHNARRASSPVINLIGEHATWHKAADPPLAMSIERLTSTVSAWERTADSVETLSNDMAEAVRASRKGQVASLIVPNDVQLAQIPEVKIHRLALSSQLPNRNLIDASARVLREKGHRAALLLGGPGLFGRGLEVAGSISAATDCLLLSSRAGRVDRGAGLPLVQRIPYFSKIAIRELTSRIDTVVVVGSQDPVTFFGYPGIPSYIFGSDKEVVRPWKQGQDVIPVLEALHDAVGGNRRKGTAVSGLSRPELPGGRLTAEKACRVLAALQPEGCIVVEEGISSALAYYPLTEHLPYFSLLGVSGGATGYGLPCAVGAALACPDRKVITLEADGSALFTVQALWTQAQQGLDIVNLILSNRSYNSVKVELLRGGMNTAGPTSRALTEIDHPPIDWLSLAKGFGLHATAVETAGGMAAELKRSLSEKGPSLIEVRL